MASKRVLLVDDEPDVVASLKFRLEKAGFDVVSAENGAAAIEVLRRRRVDLILADFMMPEVNGIELTRLVKSHPTWFDTKVMLFSCNIAPEFRQRAMAMGAVDYLPKTAGAQRIIERVSELIGSANTSFLDDEHKPEPDAEPASSRDNNTGSDRGAGSSRTEGAYDGEDSFRLQLESLSKSLVDILHLAATAKQLDQPTDYALESARRIADDIKRLSSPHK